jgi:DNA primase
MEANAFRAQRAMPRAGESLPRLLDCRHLREELGISRAAAEAITRDALARNGYRDPEINAAGILADNRWPGRLCGAWRNEWGRIGMFWARAIDERVAPERRYLYLRGASRTNLSPYGLARHTRELVLVEGFLDYHQLAARGVDKVAALGGTSTRARLFEKLSRLGVETVVLCLDNDEPGRTATARAVENAAHAETSPAIYVANADGIEAKDPDALLCEDGIGAWRKVIDCRECAIIWRVKEIVSYIGRDTPLAERREALRRAGTWLGTLPPRMAVEQEDAVQVAAKRCGYSPEAATRAFRARYFHELANSPPPQLDRKVESSIEL